MIQRSKANWLPLFAACLSVAGATAPLSAADAPAKVTYDDHVLPLLRDRCVGCHNPDKKRGGLVLNNYTRLMEGGSSGVCVKPGDPDGSMLLSLMAHKQEPFMPPSSPQLPKENLDLVARWIAGGAAENAGSKIAVAEKPKVDFTLTTVTKGKPDGPPPMPPATLRLEPVVRSPRGTTITALASSPWAPLLAVGGVRQVLLYHADTLELLGVLPFPEGVPHVLRFSRTGGLLLAGGGRAGKSGRVVVWSVARGERLFEVGDESDAVLAADVSPDQTQVALGGPSKVVRIYSTRDGKLQHEIRKHTDWVTALEFSPDGVLLATGDRSSGLYVWEAFTAREYHTLRGHTGAVTAVSWRPDSNVVASTSEDGSVRLHEMENGNQIRTWGAHGGGALSVNYGRDGRLVTTGRDRVTKLWDGNGGAQRAFEAFPDVGMRALFSHDGTKVIAGDWTGGLAVWNSADGKRLGTLTANPPTVAEQIALAEKQLAQEQKAQEGLLAAATASRAALAKLTADLAAAQKAVTDTAGMAQVAAQKHAQAGEAAGKGKQALAAAQAEARARAVLAQALNEAAAKVRVEADRVREDRPLAAAATRARALADGCQNELAQAQKAVNDLGAAQQALDANLTAALQALTAAQQAAANAPRVMQGLQAALKPAQDRAAADQANLDRAAAGLKLAQAGVARWKAAATLTRAPTK